MAEIESKFIVDNRTIEYELPESKIILEIKNWTNYMKMDEFHSPLMAMSDATW